MSERIVSVVKKSPISIYLRLPQQRHTLSALLHLRECISNTPSRVTQCSLFLGVPLQTTHPKQKRKRAISQHLVSIFRSGANCLEPLPDCLPSLALEYSSSSSYASVLSTTSTWGTSKGSENDTSKHVETICQFILS
ncbi:hypothetical protein ACFX2A_015347 [Malus domestica]